MALFNKKDSDKKVSPYKTPSYSILFGTIFIAIAVVLCTNPANEGINWGAFILYILLGLFLFGWGIYMFIARSKAINSDSSDNKSSERKVSSSVFDGIEHDDDDEDVSDESEKDEDAENETANFSDEEDK